MSATTPAKRSLTLWVPGLLHPQRLQEALNNGLSNCYPIIQKLLSKADYRTSKSRDFEAQACYLFHQANPLPSAALRASVLIADDFKQAAQDFWLSVDPVQMIPDRDTLRLFPAQDLAITADESQQLMAAFNQHFAQDQVQLIYGAPEQWFMQIKQPIDLQSTALMQAAYQSLNNAYPRGNASSYWRQLINETQMLFYTHPVNEKRREQGMAEINSIWPWGEGVLNTSTINLRPNAAVFADAPYLRGLAKVCQSSVNAQPVNFTQWQQQSVVGHSLLYLDDLVKQIPNMQLEQWLSALSEFENQWIEPIHQALADRQLDSVFLDLGANKQFHITPSNLKRFWRFNKKLTALCN